jgi:hypothetical protein
MAALSTLGQIFADDPVKQFQIQWLFNIIIKPQLPVLLTDAVITAKRNYRQAREVRFDPLADLFARIIAKPAIQQNQFWMVPPDHIQGKDHIVL